MTERRRQRGRRAQRYGRRAETLAIWLLRAKGYRVLDTNVREMLGEIDIVAQRGSTVAFIEVKARASLNTAAYAVTARQRARIERAAQLYLARHPALAGAQMRFDALLLAPRRLPLHIAGAW